MKKGESSSFSSLAGTKHVDAFSRGSLNIRWKGLHHGKSKTRLTERISGMCRSELVVTNLQTHFDKLSILVPRHAAYLRHSSWQTLSWEVNRYVLT